MPPIVLVIDYHAKYRAGRLARLEDLPELVLISSHDAANRGWLSRAPVKGFLRERDLGGAAFRALPGE